MSQEREITKEVLESVSTPKLFIKNTIQLYVTIFLFGIFSNIIMLYILHGISFKESKRDWLYIFSIGGIAIMIIFFFSAKKRNIKMMFEKKDLKKKKSFYRSILIEKLLYSLKLMMFIVIFYGITKNFLFLGFSLVVLGLMIYWIPTKEKIMKEMQLSKEDENHFLYKEDVPFAD